MTPWSPFSGAPMDGVEMRTNSARCYVCGELLRKGERGIPSRPSRVDGPSGRENAYPMHGGKITVHQTFRHRGCAPA